MDDRFGRQERYQDFDHRDRNRYQDDSMDRSFEFLISESHVPFL